jgi:hypothetical protein
MLDDMVGPRGPYAEYGGTADFLGALGLYRPELPADVVEPDAQFPGRVLTPDELLRILLFAVREAKI